MAPDGSKHPALPDELAIAARDGTQLYVRTWRSNSKRTPLVLCDGLGCDGFVWRYIIDRFAGERDLVHLHYRGHGKSEVPKDDATVTLAAMVDDIVHVLDEVGIERGVWLGHSMGVQVCLEGFRRAPDRVSGLGLLCGSYERPIDTWHHAFFEDDDAPLGNRLMRRAFAGITEGVIQNWGRLQPFWRRLVQSEFALAVTMAGELNPDLVEKGDFAPYMHHLANMDMRVFARLARDLAEHSAKDVLPGIDVPTLVVGGGRDRFCPLWLSEDMHRMIPNSELLRLVQGSHTAPIEEPRLVERALVKLFARVDG